MQVLVIVMFLTARLLILWVGSLVLKMTGMERRQARFQALSALTGTGFTTGAAESVVNHPKRRTIATWLIFTGNTGIVAFIILMILYLRARLEAPSLLHTGIIRLTRRSREKSYPVTEELLHQSGDYDVAHLSVSEIDSTAGLRIEDTGLSERGITILAIEHGDSVISFPQGEEAVLAGAYFLCLRLPRPDPLATSGRIHSTAVPANIPFKSPGGKKLLCRLLPGLI